MSAMVISEAYDRGWEVSCVLSAESGSRWSVGWSKCSFDGRRVLLALIIEN